MRLIAGLRLSVFMILACELFILSRPAFGVLGEDESSLEKVRASMAGQIQSTAHSLFTVHRISSPGISINEYADRNGLIFAVRWQGTTNPNLKLLLGRFREDYQSAVAQAAGPHVRRAHREYFGNDVTVERFGHQRNLQGIAYIRDRIPEGVSTNDLR